MFLKSLTLRGFKSFADKTVLEFEPGITVVVGPNGSGKSNIVDGIAWVLGAQGPRSLRGGKMEDVIFAGSGVRPGLGRAEVTLTIVNTAGLLPIDYSEVSITRVLYRSGESEYALNGTPCRLLDITELLSDTGIGHELHTILSQGNLDEIVQGRPEDRRAAIEEAAGIYKHRRRKEKALRKLAGMEQQLLRLGDLVGELRRQLKPLEQQAETARKAAEVAAELREVRLVGTARELAAARATAASLAALEAAHRERTAAAEAAVAAAERAELRATAESDGGEAAARAGTELAHRLATSRERLRGTLALAEEQARHLGSVPEAPEPERPTGELVAQAERIAADLTEVTNAEAAMRARADRTDHARLEAEAALAALDEELAGAWRRQEATREHELRLRAEASGLQAAAARAESDAAQLAADRDAEQERLGVAGAAAERLAAELGRLEEREAELAERLALAEEARAGAAAQVVALTEDERRRGAAHDVAVARGRALEQAVRAAGGDLLAALGDLGRKSPDALLALGAELRVAAGYEAAVGAALGPDADALVGGSSEAAAGALRRLQAARAGRAILLHPAPAGDPLGPVSVERGAAPPDERSRLLRWVQADGAVRSVVERLLGDVLVADELGQARALLAVHPECRVVTRAGDLLGPGRIEGGAPPEEGVLAARRAAAEAAAEADRTTGELDRIRAELAAARAELDALEQTVRERTGELDESDALITATAERLARANADREAAARAVRSAEATLTELAERRSREGEQLAGVLARLAAARAAGQGAPDAALANRQGLAAAAAAARTEAVEARVRLSAVEERRRLLAAAEAELRERAAWAAAAAERRARLLAARTAAAEQAEQLVRLAGAVLERLERSLERAASERDRHQTSAAQAKAELDRVVAERRAAGEALDALHASDRESDEARLEARLRAEELARRVVADYGVGPDEVLAEYLVGPEAAAELPAGDPRLLDDTELRRVGTALDRRLALLGRVNPLALEEFKALEERYAFLSGQLQDLRESRRDLLKVVRAVDERVREVFAAAFADVAGEFERTFALLFPGGAGRLVLTDPEDLLGAGVEVDARPPGKRVRRLSLLSGGERSLVALAFCFAVFRARPSPFYVLDEVEAALDDVNLQRFIELLADMREQAQLLVVSHQRRTMEAADGLYGVSMQSGGVSKVVSERLRAPADPVDPVLAAAGARA